MSRNRERRRRSEQLVAAGAAIYTIALLLAFVIVVLRTIPPSSIPALQAIVLFLGLLASVLMAVSQLIKPENDGRL
jgi:hypothetical protein